MSENIDEEINELALDDEDEIEEADFEDILPVSKTKTVKAIVTSTRTGKRMKLTFVIKTSILKLPQIINSTKKMQVVNSDGTVNIDTLGNILSIWKDIVIKQPQFFKEDLARYRKNPKSCKLDGEIVRDILIQVYTAYKGMEDYEEDEIDKQVKN